MTSALFTPFELGPIHLPNRIVVAPMCQYSAQQGIATDWHLMHLGQLAAGGAGLVMVEATAVEPRGRITHGCLGLYDGDCETALGRILAAARQWSGSTRFGIQLAHAGRKASARRPWEGGDPLDTTEDPWQIVAPSALPFADGWPAPTALDARGLETIREAFVAAARRAARIGFDVVELHCAHGYLLHEFLSPITNRRDDAYSGGLANRMRYPLEVIEAVRTALPAGVALGVRISATDWLEGGWTAADSVAFARLARALGVVYVCCSSGGIAPGAKIPLGPAYQVPFAEQVRREGRVATRAVGMITHAEQADDIVAKGRADLVALARGFLYDPRWAWHAADRLGASTEHPAQYARARDLRWVRAMGLPGLGP
jgi:2,4-dienoyl-CoA reductase-like NADH-dependent reductase (Old Yellow Enzyme family)